MPRLRLYDLFISHAWAYREEYGRLVDMLDSVPNFSWRNLSVPAHDPLDGGTDVRLRRALSEQVRRAHAVLAVGGVNATHSPWIGEELDIAASYAKPVIGVVPRGNQRVSSVVQRYSVEWVRWSAHSIVNAIRAHAI